MAEIESVDVLIAGSGPAGMSTALHLAQAHPAWANRVVVVDKAIHPREKLCGGAITRPGTQILAALGLSLEPAHVPVREVRLVYQDVVFTLRADPVFQVVRRDEFDHWLVRCGQQLNVTVRQDEAVKEVTPQPDFVEVITERTIFHARVLVAADGSRSVVRQKLKWEDQGGLARLLEVLTPEIAEKQVEFCQGVAVFDFSGMATGLQGYYWDFPSLIQGRPFMNRGVFDSRVRPERPHISLKEILRQALAQRNRNLAGYELKGHPIHWFNPAGRFAQPRILLAGDAAGVDPLLGEGIAFALAYGEAAAAAIVDAFTRQDFNFSTYRQRILAHPLLAQLSMRAKLARITYLLKNPRLIRWAWSKADLLIGCLAWYNPAYVSVTHPRLVRLDHTTKSEEPAVLVKDRNLHCR